jgi:CrcB protein
MGGDEPGQKSEVDRLSLAVVLGVGALGGAGAVARFALDGAVSARAGGAFPYGTWIVNVAGSFALGIVFGAAVGQNTYRLVGTGLIGAFTTFSTWMLEGHRLAEDGEFRLGALNLVVTLLFGILAVWAGRHVGAWL